MKKHSAFITVTLVLTLGTSVPSVYAHTEVVSSNKEPAAISTDEKPFGRQGDPKKVTRTIEVSMNDMMRFDPPEIMVKEGETIKFIVTNQGKMMHEMVLGTLDELKEHQEMMKKHPGMEHDEPYMTHVAPRKKASMVWQFAKAGDFYYACLIAGHFEAGMVGKIKVVKR